MVIVSLAAIALEVFYGVIVPFTSNDSALAFTQTPVYWALAVPVLVMSIGALAIIAWIGFTLIVTPPPEVWDVEELEKIDVSEPSS